MKRVLLSLFLVAIALIGICSVSAADTDSVVVDNSHVALGDALSIISYSQVVSDYHAQIADTYVNWHHDRNQRGFTPVGLDDCNDCPYNLLAGISLRWHHHERNSRG
ncbi:hypothetical protein [Methanobrevibacter sp.]|uniref:hypothetical protein n=1 Tax=Methanobrevibacter sp. TaxID=66852 RepID=UPI003890AC3A